MQNFTTVVGNLLCPKLKSNQVECKEKASGELVDSL